DSRPTTWPGAGVTGERERPSCGGGARLIHGPPPASAVAPGRVASTRASKVTATPARQAPATATDSLTRATAPAARPTPSAAGTDRRPGRRPSHQATAWQPAARARG